MRTYVQHNKQAEFTYDEQSLITPIPKYCKISNLTYVEVKGRERVVAATESQ